MPTGPALYVNWKQAILSETPTNKSLDQTDATNGTYCALLLNTYVFNQAHQFYSDLGVNVAGTPQQIIAPTLTIAGNLVTYDGNDVTFISVTGGTVNAFVVYRHNSGANTTWRLIYFNDNLTVSGFPVTPAGGNVIVSWNPTGIFQF
jgi:hypothetical protein